jgi:outer membrane protein
MKRFVSFCFFIFWITLFFVPHIHAQALKIGVFDLQRIMRDSKNIQSYRKVLGREIETKRKLFEEKQDSVRLLEDRLKRDDKTITPDERRRLGERLANESKELRRMREDLDADLQKIDRELSRRALKEIGDVINNLGKQDNYSMIFERTMAGIAYFRDSFDITQKIIDLYDAKK